MKCLFCGSEQIVPARYPRPTSFNGKIFTYQQCIGCDLVFIDPIPSQDDYNKMYGKSYHDTFYFKEEKPDYTGLLEALQSKVGDKTIVDYGCGDGSFLQFFAKAGYKGIGVEYDPELVEKLKQQNPGTEFYTVDEFWNAGNELRFSVIFFGDVLEHLDKPAEFVRSVFNKLPPNGLIMAQGPLENNDNLGLYFRKFTSSLATGEKRLASHIPYHITFTNATNQEKLFNDAGFKTEFYEVNETPWPLPSKFSPDPVKAAQYLVGQASMLLSKAVPAKQGNRFIYIGRK